MKHIKAIVATLLIIAMLISYVFIRNKKGSIIQENIVYVGTNAEFPPFTFIKNDEIVGFDIDIIKEVAQRIGKKIVIKDMPFANLLPQLQLGSLQVLAAGMTPTKERAQYVLFTDPYLSASPLIVISLATHPINSLEDLQGKTVVVNEGFTADVYMSEISGITLNRLPTIADAFLALNTKRAYAFVTAENTVQPFFDQYDKQKYALYPIEGTGETTALAISKKHPSLLEPIQNALHSMKEDGTLQNLKNKWGLQ